MGELGVLSWVRVPALLPCPVGDIVGEGFVLQGQGPREDLVTPFNAETEIWSSWDMLHVWFTTPIAELIVGSLCGVAVVMFMG